MAYLFGFFFAMVVFVLMSLKSNFVKVVDVGGAPKFQNIAAPAPVVQSPWATFRSGLLKRKTTVYVR